MKVQTLVAVLCVAFFVGGLTLGVLSERAKQETRKAEASLHFQGDVQYGVYKIDPHRWGVLFKGEKVMVLDCSSGTIVPE